MKRRGETSSLICAVIAAAVAVAVSPTATVARPGSAANARIAATLSIARAKRAIAAIGARRATCKANDYSPQLFEECDGKAIDAYNKLLPRARTGARRDDLLAAMLPAFQEAQNPDRAYYSSDSLAGDVATVSAYADFARRRAEILTGVSSIPSPLKPVRGEQGLFDWIDRTPDLRRSTSNSISTREATRRWDAIRTADCAAYPVPRCSERLDDEMRRMVRDLTVEQPSSFKKGEKRPPRRF